MHHYLLMLGVAVVTINGQGILDAPVIITRPVDLDKPTNLIMDATLDRMSLACSAKNADTVEWKFKATQADPFTELIASSWTQESATLDPATFELTRVLNEQVVNNRTLLNGYYQCVAGNRFGFEAITPPVRILYPSLLTKTSQVNTISGTEGEGLRLPCYSGSGSVQITPSDYLDLSSQSAIYTWTLFSTDGINPTTDVRITSDNRTKIDLKSGDLVFKFITANDAAIADPSNPYKVREYRCSLAFASIRPDVVIGIYRLTVRSAEPADTTTRWSAEKTTKKAATSQEGVTCYLLCLNDGRGDGQHPRNGKLSLPGKFVKTGTTPTGSYLSNPSSDADGRWTCSLDSDRSAGTAEIEVTVLQYPTITPLSMVPQLVTTGSSEVNFYCLPVTLVALNTKFYKYRSEATAGSPGMTVATTSVEFNSILRNTASSISCVRPNNADSTLKTASLVVYDKPTIEAQPVSGHSVLENVINEEYTLNCSVTLDSKAHNPVIYWKTNAKKLANVKISRPNTDSEIMNVDIKMTPPMRTANLRIKYNSETEDSLKNSMWWCECVFDVAVGGGKVKAFSVTSNKVNFDILAPPKPALIAAAISPVWVIGVAAAVIFIILLTMFNMFCLRRKKGKQCYGEWNSYKVNRTVVEKECGSQP